MLYVNHSDKKPHIHPVNEKRLERVIAFLNKWIERYSTTNIEMPKETGKIVKDSSALYISTHKSLWETLGIPYAIIKDGGEVPYIVMGKNLVKGKPFLNMMQSIKVIPLDRNGKGNAAREMIGKIDHLLNYENNILMFPQDGRSRLSFKPFRTTAAQGIIKSSEKGTRYLVCANVDYSYINEEDVLASDSKKQYTFFAWHALRWIHNIGDVYISFSKPIAVMPDMDRTELTRYAQQRCLDLVKILPVNVNAEAALRNSTNRKGHIYNIDAVMHDLEPYADRFRGFDMDTSPAELFREYGIKHTENLQRLYAMNIAHYLSNTAQHSRIIAANK